MSALPALKFTVTPTQFDALEGQAIHAGILIKGDLGAATDDGITIAWEYDRATSVLQLQCTQRHGFATLMSQEFIQGKIRNLVTANGGVAL